ncbi:flagellar biosynthesis regulator FlaF [Leisingera methylohalidivorans]|uniref:Flagellar biosynthesis regulatory protein FlaF n=1 Tax=Leisingera methylohalidivorans DSM 14336 TaxID=999552 RepID=V9VXU3_9RHOB|nr:flagellar biosynthesis regulator FlaF [Leisingera methylohalidivorans]AHD02748.1 flagellar biosynthesis regulatory protein FlaF [Leisingera methylohalidivorans DSM 14336]
MNALLKAKSAYSAAQAPTRTAKNLEYEAIARVTRQLVLTAQKGRDGFPELTSALTKNRKLWTIFVSDLASKDNPLPADLKENLFYLAEFTRQHTSKVLQRKADVRPLVEINTAIMRGLRGGAS